MLTKKWQLSVCSPKSLHCLKRVFHHAGATRCPDKREIWHRGANGPVCYPVPTFTFIGEKVGEYSPKIVKILNFAHKFAPTRGDSFANFFYEILIVCRRL